MNTQPDDSTQAPQPASLPGNPGEIIGTSAMRFPRMDNPTKGAILFAVLKRGAVEDYAVYESIIPTDALGADYSRDSKYAHWTAEHGIKANLKRALLHFPALDARHYRA